MRKALQATPPGRVLTGNSMTAKLAMRGLLIATRADATYAVGLIARVGWKTPITTPKVAQPM